MDTLLYRKLMGEQAIPTITNTGLSSGIDFNNQSGLVGTRPSITGLQKLGNLASGALSAAGALLGGPMGWISLGVKALGDNIAAARPQFDINAFKDMADQSFADFNQTAGSANTTSDLLNLQSQVPDFNDYIDNQGYEWDGNILSGIGAFIGNRRTEDAKQNARNMVSQYGDSITGGLNTASKRVSDRQYMQGMANFLNNAAMGGPLSTHGSDFTDDLIRIDVGGTHEQNPLGGIPAGVDPQGIPNLVEEGETIWDDYVFSDRLKAPKNYLKKYKLGGDKKKGADRLSFSDAARKVAEKSGVELRPNDPISKRTRDAMLTELEEEQEDVRMKKQQKDFIKALSEMSPEEFEAVMFQNPEVQTPAETEIPPQGMNEEIPAEQPLMQEPMGFEPQGLQGFALGGNMFPEGGNKKQSTAFARRARLFRKAIADGDLVYHPETRSYVGNVPGYGRVANTESFVNGIINTPQSKRQQAIIEAYNNGALSQNEGGFWSGNTADGAIAGMSTKQLERYLEHPVTDAQRKISEDYKGRKAQEREAKRQETRELYQNLNAANAAPQASQRHEVIGPYQDPLYDSRIEPNLRGLRTLGNRGTVNLENPWYSYLVPNGNNSVGVVNGVGVVSTDQPSTPRGGTQGTGTVRTGTRRTPASQTIPNWMEDVDWVDSILTEDSPVVENTPINLGRDNLVVSKMATPARTAGDNTLPTRMRYAPIVGGGLSVLSDIFSQPDYSGYEGLVADARRLQRPVNIPVTTIGNRLRRNPFDERLMVNQANQNFLAGLRSTFDTAGGNRAFRQYATNNLVRNGQNALSDIARNSFLANRQDALQTADFNRATDLYNMNAINQRNLAQGQLNSNRDFQGFNARMNALNALENARRYDDQLVSADLTGFLQGLGNLGRENFIFNQIDARRREGLSPVSYNGDKSGIWQFYGADGGKKKTKKRRF